MRCSNALRLAFSFSNSKEDIDGLVFFGLEAIKVLFFSITPQSNPRYFASPTKLSLLSFHTFLPPDVVVAL